MSSADVAARAEQLRRERVPFVHARVIRAEKPTSAKPGDEAVVLSNGAIEGFVGGTCAEATVRAQALALFEQRQTRMLRITPRDETDRQIPPDTVLAHNPCLSGGALEIFLEPVIPPPLVLVHGESPVARALVAIGKALGHDVLDPVAVGSFDGAWAVVVASHGRGEEETVQAALAAGVPYVGLVASPKRGTAVVASLGLSEEQRSRVHTPAGLDIGAVTAEEVALSIFTQIVALRPGQWRTADDTHPHEAPAGLDPATDPVCGMSVAPVTASLHLDHLGVRYWFCGTGCLRAFSAEPAAYPSR
ncbi:MAG: XdhC family protein [Sporichthyaceae bacterium]